MRYFAPGRLLFTGRRWTFLPRALFLAFTHLSVADSGCSFMLGLPKVGSDPLIKPIGDSENDR